MANLLYRVSSTPTIPSSSSVKNAPLTNLEVDANFKSLSDAIDTAISGVPSLTGSYSNPSWITSLSETKVLPSQTGNAGKYLTTNGTSTSWTTLTLPAGQTSGSATVGYLAYNGTTKAAGQLDGGSSNPSNTTRLNYDGYFYATKFYGDGSALTGIDAAATVTNDTATNASVYPLWVTTTSGSVTIVSVSDTKLYFNPSTGTLNATVFNSLSDATQKTNVQTIENATDTLSKIAGVEFDWVDGGQHSAGVIAQELEQILPFLVATGPDGIKSVNYNGLIAYLIQANKELAARVQALEAQ